MGKNESKTPIENKFAAIKGHRSIIDVDAIKRGNHERKVAAVGAAVNALAEAVRNEHAKRKAARLLAEDEEKES